MKTILPVIVLVSLLIPVASSRAANPSPSLTPLTASVYHLRTGDRVSVEVYRESKLSRLNVPIDAKGDLQVAAIEAPIHAEGLSVQAATLAIEEAYKKNGLVAEPRAFVTVREYAQQALNKTLEPTATSGPLSIFQNR